MIMTDLRKDQKKNLARDLYILGQYTYEEIGAKVGVQRQTVSRWAKEGKWDDTKAGMSVTREENLKYLNQHLKNINMDILKRDEANRQPTTKEADVMVKIAAAIKSMELDVGIADIISVGMRFTEWLRRVDLEKAKDFIPYWDSFIKEQAK